jgi:hypothetical protein
MIHMAMDTVGKCFMENGKHHFFQKWKDPGVLDDFDDEWDDHVRAYFPPHAVDGNIGL